MGENTIIIYRKPDGGIGEMGTYEWYDNEYESKGFKYIDCYNSAFRQHREWARKEIRRLLKDGNIIKSLDAGLIDKENAGKKIRELL